MQNMYFYHLIVDVLENEFLSFLTMKTANMLDNQVNTKIWQLEVLSLPQIMKLSKMMTFQPCS